MGKNESKSRNSILNALTSILYTGVNGILTIIVTRIILVHYGSDYNGLNTTANQIVSILLVLESGFTLASNVALFSPIAENDKNKISRIISTTKASFIRISIIYLVVGLITVIGYSRFIISEIPYYEILLILLVSLLPTAFNFMFATKYAVLFQSSQHEYIINIIKIVSCAVGHSVVIILGMQDVNRILLRVLILFNPTLAVILTALIGRKTFKDVKMDCKPDYSLIPGTKDLMVQKFVGLVYSTAPTLLMSAKIGTVAISIYGVYNSVTVLMKSVANAFMNSPRMSLGALISEGNADRIRRVFREYENIVFLSGSIMTVIYFSLIVPFVRLYTLGVDDANYIQPTLAVILGLIFFIECIHIPSGIFLNMAGLFKVSKFIQTIAAVILGIGILISMFVGTMTSFVISIFIAAISLAIMEIGYVHFMNVIENSSMDKKGLIDLLIYGAIALLLSSLGYNIYTICDSYYLLILKGIIITIITFIIYMILLTFYNKYLFRRIRNIAISLGHKSQ